MSICLHGSTFLGSVVEVVNKIVSAFTGREFYELDWEEHWSGRSVPGEREQT